MADHGEEQPTFSGEPPASPDDVPEEAWEEVSPGRYMPRRIRGSCLGRELG